ncbi:hypothetical protein MMC07_008313 [Pseudocyphellaria aurata]|nr:hypothetical protein [Pseudocyphellaria aurata]
MTSTRQALSTFRRLSFHSRLLPPRRAFHASPQHRLLDTCVGVVHSALIGIHSFTGLPWVISIPCFALVTRTLLVSPITLYLQKVNCRKASLKPVSLAWIHAIRVKVQQEHGRKGPKACQQEVMKMHRRKMNEIDKRHGVQLWRNLLSFVQVPLFLLVVETLRKMCGAKKGLLGLVTSEVPQEYQSVIEAIPLEQAIAQDDGEELFSFEESFANEGALWFPDLLVPDPLMILPFVLSGSLFLSISYQASRSKDRSQSKWGGRFLNGMRVIALVSGPFTLQVPSAMLLYWISSTLFGLGQVVLMQRYMPAKPPPIPCKTRDQRVLLGTRPPN